MKTNNKKQTKPKKNTDENKQADKPKPKPKPANKQMEFDSLLPDNVELNYLRLWYKKVIMKWVNHVSASLSFVPDCL